MNKKNLLAILAAAAVLVIALVLAVKPGKTETQPEATETASVENVQMETDAMGETVTTENAENTEESAKNENETKTAGNTGGNTGSNAAGNTETAADETEPLIPEENVQMGVVPGADDGGLDDVDIEDVPAQNVTPTEPKQDTAGNDEEDQLPTDFDITKLTYEQYNAMSGAQQKQVIDMFGSVEEFMKWYRAVEALYKAEHPDIEIGADGVIDAEELIK